MSAPVYPAPVPARAVEAGRQSQLAGVLPDEAELTAGVRIQPGRAYGFFTDTTLCIGCKACEVACKEWNNLPADELGLTGHSYDNTGALSANTWRHVRFVEHSVRNDIATPFHSLQATSQALQPMHSVESVRKPVVRFPLKGLMRPP